MRKFTSALAALAMMGTSIAASTAAYAGVFTGMATVQKGIILNCAVSVDLYSVPGKAILTIAPGDPLCAALTITSNPHDYTLVGGVLVIKDIRVETITLGNCFGDLTATVIENGDGSKTLIVEDEIPPETGALPCLVVGELWKPAH